MFNPPLGAAANLAPFSLSLEGIPPEAYTVHRWRYAAALDEPYTLTVVLHIARPFAELFGRSLGSRLNRPDGLRGVFHLQAQALSWEPLHGAISQCVLGADSLAPQEAPLSADLIACTLTLRPRLWWASLATGSRSFQRLSVPDVLRQVLQQGLGFGAADLDFRLGEPPLRHRYRQQYQETDLAFVSRLLEREGFSYFFEQSDEREVMVVTDSAQGFTRPPQWSGVRFRGLAGLNASVQALLSPPASWAHTTRLEGNCRHDRTHANPLRGPLPDRSARRICTEHGQRRVFLHRAEL